MTFGCANARNECTPYTIPCVVERESSVRKGALVRERLEWHVSAKTGHWITQNHALTWSLPICDKVGAIKMELSCKERKNAN